MVTKALETLTVGTATGFAQCGAQHGHGLVDMTLLGQNGRQIPGSEDVAVVGQEPQQGFRFGHLGLPLPDKQRGEVADRRRVAFLCQDA